MPSLPDNKVNAFISEDNNKIEVSYTYTYYSKKKIFNPLTWLLVKVQIKGIMLRALPGIKQLAQSGEDFVYETK